MSRLRKAMTSANTLLSEKMKTAAQEAECSFLHYKIYNIKYLQLRTRFTLVTKITDFLRTDSLFGEFYYAAKIATVDKKC